MTENTAAAATATVSADVAKKAQGELAKIIRTARKAYSTTAAEAKVTRESLIAAAYAAFTADPTIDGQQALARVQRSARTDYKDTVAAAKVARDTLIAAAYADFAASTAPAPVEDPAADTTPAAKRTAK
jgi:hypothetical protein